jgi:prepilin-type N-terminal cleavage/methylation domain-containing protein
MKEVYLMKKRKTDEKGFTLIEVIVTLVLVGITAALAGMWIVSVVNGYIFTKMNASTVQKAQLAMMRLAKEFTDLQLHSVTGASGTGITFDRADSASTAVPIIISMNDTQLQIDVNSSGAQTLTDSVSVFSLTYCTNATGVAACGDESANTCSATWTPRTSRSIRIDLTIKGANNTDSKFTQCVTPRNS